jgi:hypothetical protein
MSHAVNTEDRSGTKKNEREVVVHPEGWAVKMPGADKASSVHGTQAEAIARAKEIVTNLGGGEVRVQGKDGKWRDSDTVAPGNDPNPPKG